MRRIVIAIALALSPSFIFGQVEQSGRGNFVNKLTVQLRSSSDHVRLGDDVLISVFFRAPRGSVTLWNAFGWSSSTGMSLRVMDTSGHQVKEFTQMFDVLPPDESGNGALITIGGDSFAGFDSHIPATSLFVKPGKYTLKCVYTPALPRDYFHGNTIWGKEDGAIGSRELVIFVDK